MINDNNVDFVCEVNRGNCFYEKAILIARKNCAELRKENFYGHQWLSMSKQMTRDAYANQASESFFEMTKSVFIFSEIKFP